MNKYDCWVIGIAIGGVGVISFLLTGMYYAHETKMASLGYVQQEQCWVKK